MRQQRADGWVKRNDRQKVNLEATVLRGDSAKVPARLSNISFEGCQLECGVTLEIGERIKIALPGLGEISAQVRWSLPGKAGAWFLPEEPLPTQRKTPTRA